VKFEEHLKKLRNSSAELPKAPFKKTLTSKFHQNSIKKV
jgi:hypothetical protein